MRKHWFLIRLAIAAVLFVYLYKTLDWQKFTHVIAQSQWSWLAAAFLAYGITTALAIGRWQILLSACHAPAKLHRTAQLTMIGLFANSFMPGIMSGDLIKIFYAVREIPHIKPAVVMSVFMERLLGFIAMFLVSTLLILARFDALTREPATRWAVYFYFFCFGILFLFILLASWKKTYRLLPFLQKLPWQKTLREASEAYHFFLSHPRCFWGGLGISICAHFSLMSMSYFIALALGLPIQFWDLAAVLPLVMLITLIPATPGGLGVREIAFQHFLLFAGIAEEASVALSLGGFFIILTWQLLGGLVFLQFRSPPPKSARISI